LIRGNLAITVQYHSIQGCIFVPLPQRGNKSHYLLLLIAAQFLADRTATQYDRLLA